MAYNPNIPQPTDIIANSQADLLNNFMEINTLVDVNHQTFGAADAGKHKFLQMPEQSVAPDTAVNEAGLYAAVGATSDTTELVFRRENNGAAIAFTECVAPAANNATGWTRLPSGIIMQWGTIAVVNGNATIVFPIAFPSYCYNIQVTNNVSAANQQNYVNVDSSTVSTTGCTAHAYTRSPNPANTNLYYFAIGI